MQGVYVSGYELVKAQSNSPEDYFNKSEFCYSINGEEKVFTVLYLRFFEENLAKYVPYSENPLFVVENKSFELKHIVAFVLFQKDKEVYTKRKQVYINNDEAFAKIFENVDWALLQDQLKLIRLSDSPILT